MNPFHSVNLANCLHIFIRKSDRGKQLNILHIIFIEISISCIFHIRNACPDAGKKGNAQCHDQ